MKICDEIKESKTKELPKLVGGHIYRHVTRRIDFGEPELHIYCAYNNTLVDLETGRVWSAEGYGRENKPGDWEDVTNQYCLKKIK